MYADELDKVILKDFITGASRSEKTAAEADSDYAALSVANIGPIEAMKIAGGLAALAEREATLKEACDLFELPPRTVAAVVKTVF